MKLSFNSSYTLKQDIGRTILLPKETYRDVPEIYDAGFEALIHPVHAMILSFFNHTEMEEGISEAASYLGLDPKTVRNFVEKLNENESVYEVKTSNGFSCVFPRRVLIQSEHEPLIKYNPNDFIYNDIDIRLKRHSTPTDITLMVNTRCATDCIYCYADRRQLMDCKIPLEQVIKIIREAREINARSFEIIGGEFFVYKYWKEVLKELLDQGFTPYLSTKIPLSEKSVAYLAEVGLPDIQISLDTLVNQNLKAILQVEGQYSRKMQNTLVLLNKYNIKVVIHTILNKKNQTIEDMKSIFDFIKGMKNITSWRIDPAGPSMYLGCNSFDNYRPDKPHALTVYEYLKELSTCSGNINISYEGVRQSNISDKQFPEQEKSDTRPSCTANYSKLFILPDGKVTICEELYWHPTFIMGNVIDNTLQEIWDSGYAHYLYKIPQNHIPKDSACSGCGYYESCKEKSQTCWRDVVKGYGDDKWYFPDVSCEHAPKVTNYI